MPAIKQPLLKVVSLETWEASLNQLLIKEKALTQARDALSAERRKQPMVNLGLKTDGINVVKRLSI
ncbi:DUF899 family protein [Halomonas sp. SpR8]|uniref:DUF899 family protein n=1 Tax=Halomonas sp. SpR8 TaxID=3050463 RepID=UPI0027E542DE|nr:DUF899 family protein [Halomonas sp. SpR8]MDQ7730718.1 DUF899 family protein [Halomonas sp. SpR8]